MRSVAFIAFAALLALAAMPSVSGHDSARADKLEWTQSWGE